MCSSAGRARFGVLAVIAEALLHILNGSFVALLDGVFSHIPYMYTSDTE